MNNLLIEAVDQIDSARNHVWLLSMTARENPSGDDDRAAIAEACEAALERLDRSKAAIREGTGQ